MAITSIIVRRSISSVLPVAIVRRVGRRNHDQYSALSTALYNQYGPSTLSHKPCPPRWPFAASTTLLHFYSSSAEKEASTPSTADDTLVRAIESKIKSVESKIKSVEESGEDHHEAREKIPDGFPFEIEDNPGQETISLVRKYEGEFIEVKVYLSHATEEGSDDGDLEATTLIPLDVIVSKKYGTNLEFRCTALPDRILINSLYLEYGQISPFLPEMEENIVEAFKKYLEIRGIETSIYSFLYECMSKKKSKEQASWLKNVKQFVEA